MVEAVNTVQPVFEPEHDEDGANDDGVDRVTPKEPPAFPDPPARMAAAHWSDGMRSPILTTLPLQPPTPSAVEPSYMGVTSLAASEAGSVCGSLGSDWVRDVWTEDLPSTITSVDYQAQNGADGLSRVTLEHLGVARELAVAVSTWPGCN